MTVNSSFTQKHFPLKASCLSTGKSIAALIALVMVVYSNTLFMYPVWDDSQSLNVKISSIADIVTIFTSDISPFSVNRFSTQFYRPVSVLIFSFDNFVWGNTVAGFHLTNICIHILATVLTFMLASKILTTKFSALSAALLYAVHPVHSEAVAWISARSDALCATLFFLAFYYYILFANKHKLSQIVISCCFFILALLTKEMAITLPGIILLYEICFENKSVREKFRWSLIYVAVTIPYLIMRLLVLPNAGTNNVPFSQRIYMAIDIVPTYFKTLFFPINQHVFHDIAINAYTFSHEAMISLLICVFIIMATFVLAKYDKILMFSIGWILITLLPVLNIVALLKPTPMAERYLYLPSFGFAILVGRSIFYIENIITDLKNKHKLTINNGSYNSLNIIFILSFIGLIIILSIATIQKNYRWHDNYSFANAFVIDVPNNSVAHYLLGDACKERNDLVRAEQEWEKSLKLAPDNYLALNQLGVFYYLQNDMQTSKQFLEQAVHFSPNFAEAHYNLALTLEGMNDLDAARRHYIIFLDNVPKELRPLVPEVKQKVSRK